MFKQMIVVAALTVAGMAQAGNLATLKNQAGGLIYLTDSKSKDCSPDGRTMYSTNSGGGSIWGCWYLIDEMVHIVWESGGTSAFPAGAFTLVKKNKGGDL